MPDIGWDALWLICVVPIPLFTVVMWGEIFGWWEV